MAAEDYSGRTDGGKSSAVPVAGSEPMCAGNRSRPFLTTEREWRYSLCQNVPITMPCSNVYLTPRLVAIILGKTREQVWAMIGLDAKKTAEALGVEVLPLRKMPGSDEYGILRSDLFEWIRSCPLAATLRSPQKGKK